MGPGKGLAGHAWGFGMETDARKIASGGKWGYIGSQPKGKTEIPDKQNMREKLLTHGSCKSLRIVNLHGS
jgi:hypothetical protein